LLFALAPGALLALLGVDILRDVLLVECFDVVQVFVEKVELVAVPVAVGVVEQVLFALVEAEFDATQRQVAHTQETVVHRVALQVGAGGPFEEDLGAHVVGFGSLFGQTVFGDLHVILALREGESHTGGLQVQVEEFVRDFLPMQPLHILVSKKVHLAF